MRVEIEMFFYKCKAKEAIYFPLADLKENIFISMHTAIVLGKVMGMYNDIRIYQAIS